MNNLTGPPVIGKDFFGREKELDYIWKRIEAGNNIKLPSPRRVGKTSFALKLIDTAKEADWDTLTLNLEKSKSQPEFLQEFAEALKKLSWWSGLKERGSQLLDTISKLKPKVKIEDVELSLEWEKSISNIYKDLSQLLDHEKPLLIFFDELTILLSAMIKNENGKEEVTAFLHWLRDLRIRSGSKIRWIFCSSVGIENFTHQHGISDALNDVFDYELKSYSRENSIEMLLLLASSNDVSLKRDVAEAVVDKLEFCLPFFLQILFEKINILNSIEEVPIDREIAEKAYAIVIGESHFNTWIERISPQYGDLSDYAFILLKHLCQVKAGTKRDNLTNLIATTTGAENAERIVSKLLYMLKNDGYLMEEESLYRFRSPLLRDFWFTRFVK